MKKECFGILGLILIGKDISRYDMVDIVSRKVKLIQMNILVTGGTVFVSKYIATYFNKIEKVYVLNRNTRQQVNGVHLIEADRHNLGEQLKEYHFDAVIDVCAYNGKDIHDLLDALPDREIPYIMISSSAVYPETNTSPSRENQRLGVNAVWGKYGIGKIEAEHALFKRMPSAYVLRPPYLYGSMQNIYREAFFLIVHCKNARFTFRIMVV